MKTDRSTARMGSGMAARRGQDGEGILSELALANSHPADSGAIGDYLAKLGNK